MTYYEERHKCPSPFLLFCRLYALINQYDLVTAQKIIGHSSTSITAKYDRTWQEKAREAARMRVISYKTGGTNENGG